MNPPDHALVLKIDLASPSPVYLQIVDGLRAVLVAGTFRPGDRLPTVRQLAIDLAVHHNTVAEAYRMLAAEGWLELKRKSGARVLDRAVPIPTAAAHREFSQRLRELAARALADGVAARNVTDYLRDLARELKKKESS